MRKINKQKFYGPIFSFLKLSLDVVISIRNAHFYWVKIEKRYFHLTKNFSLMVVILMIKLMIQSDQETSNLGCFNLYFYLNIFNTFNT